MRPVRTFILSLAFALAMSAAEPGIDKSVLTWMQGTLDSWEAMCRQELHIPPDPLSWIIFYDSTHAWHVRPEEKLLPPHRRTRERLRFAGRRYPVFEVKHAGTLWVPGRPPLDLKPRSAAMPYNGDSKVFFVLAMPGLVAKASGIAVSQEVNDFFAGVALHEITHTRHVVQATAALKQLRGRYKMPESLDDNIIQTTFASNVEFRKMYEEAGRQIFAAFSASDDLTAREKARGALNVIRERQRRFFIGEYEGWKGMEETFLALEGAAMWVQAKHAIKVAPPNQSPQEALGRLVQRADSWSQMEGLGLFLLIDRFHPKWPTRYFSKSGAPSPLDFLEEVLGTPAPPATPPRARLFPPSAAPE